MKKAIKMLKEALKAAMYAQKYSPTPRTLDAVINLIQETIALLKAPPRWETPYQWEKRTGNKYPENAAVRVFYSPEHGWDLMEYWRAKQLVQDLWRLDNDSDVDPELIPIVCDCGVDGPPSDDWRPEETK